MQYISKKFQSFWDVAFSGTGISTVESVYKSIQLNGLDTVTPEIKENETFYVNNVINPLINIEFCNFIEIPDFKEQLKAITDILDNVIVTEHELPDTIENLIGYKVQLFESIFDVALNATGTIKNLFTILKNNGFDTLTPKLQVNQNINIDNCDIQRNIQRILEKNKACNNIEINDFDLQLSEIINSFVYPKKQFEDSEFFEFENGEQYNFE